MVMLRLKIIDFGLVLCFLFDIGGMGLRLFYKGEMVRLNGIWRCCEIYFRM